MAYDSGIEWTEHTLNGWWGCTKVHEGCDECYAETLSSLKLRDIWGEGKARVRIKSFFSNLRKYNKEAKEAGRIDKVFVGSMKDIFELSKSLVDWQGREIEGTTGQIRDDFFALIPSLSNLHFLLLTKRPSLINRLIPVDWVDAPPENVTYGTSVSNQKTAEDLIRQFSKVKGRKFVSAEPLLDSIDFKKKVKVKEGEKRMIDLLDWVIVGGESGDTKRDFEIDWAKEIIKDCQDNKTAVFFKQIDKVQKIPEHLLIREFPKHLKF